MYTRALAVTTPYGGGLPNGFAYRPADERCLFMMRNDENPE